MNNIYQTVNLGFFANIPKSEVFLIIDSDTAPIRRLIKEMREEDKRSVLDATYGRKRRSVVLLKTGHAILSSIKSETLSKRFSKDESVQ